MKDMESNRHYIVNSAAMKENKNILHVIHNAGFFSCSTIALQDIIIWAREHKGLPNIVDRHSQYMHYKSEPSQTLIGHFFNEKEGYINCLDWFEMTSQTDTELQFTDYRNLNFDRIAPFIEKYFSPSDYVNSIIKHYEEKYNIDYHNTCAVFYRGNDKNRETTIASYDAFIGKAEEVLTMHGGEGFRFLVQPDETEFLQAFTSSHPNSFNFEETPHMRKCDSAVFFEMPIKERANYAAHFLAAVIVMSRCKHMIIHSGNCGLWSVLYRGNMNNVHQILNNNWL